jgi:hypothetical protein
VLFVHRKQDTQVLQSVTDYKNRGFEQNQSHKLGAVSDRQLDTRMAKIKANFRNFSFRNLVRENIPIEVCEKSSYINMCAGFQDEKCAMT